MAEVRDLVWYFAYGSNMSQDKFVGDRGIVPLASARVRTPGWILALNIPGLPYQEPTFTAVVPREAALPTHTDVWVSEQVSQKSGVDHRDAIGVAYLISADQYRKVIGSEGGGTAYADVEINAEPLEESDRERVGGDSLQVRTLAPAICREPWPKPSQRYMDIITTGAREARLPPDYQAFLCSIDTYQAPTDKRGKLGAAIFLSIWGPVLGLMERITTATIGSDGYAPGLVILLVRFVMSMIWLTHDLFFAPVFGRGDGNPSSAGKQVSAHATEKLPLLPECRMTHDVV